MTSLVVKWLGVVGSNLDVGNSSPKKGCGSVISTNIMTIISYLPNIKKSAKLNLYDLS